MAKWLLALSIYATIGGSFLFYSDAFRLLSLCSIALLLMVYFTNPQELRPLRVLGLLALLTIPSFASLFAHGASNAVWLRPVAFGALALSAYMAGRSLKTGEFQFGLRFAVAAAFLTVPVAATLNGWDIVGALISGHRLQVTTGFHPNTLGLMFLCLCLASVIATQGMLKWGLVAACAAGALATSSRAAIASIVVAAVASEFLAARSRPAILLLLGAVGLALLFGPFHIGDSLERIFLLQDRFRGLQAGGSGRFALWMDYYTLWKEQPLLGLGLDYRINKLGVEVYAHNLVLQLLSDAGVFNLIAFTLFVLITTASLIKHKNQSEFRTAAGLCLLSYLSYGVFEGRGLNVGNPLSVFVFLSIFTYWGAAEERQRRNSRGPVLCPGQETGN